jgi:GTP diphosphokinase / guanosine-3',5'-bis(diphosphate) 3'-diphosphatase
MIEEVRKRLVKELERFYETDTEMLKRALKLAEKIHDGQFRKPKTEPPHNRDPYIIHPMRVALILLEEVGINSPELIAAALLHDVVEDSEGSITIENLESEFGNEVANIVGLLSKPGYSKEVARHEQLAVYHKNIAEAPEQIRTVKLADRLDNMREALLTNERKFQMKYLNETREIYLPLAASTGDFFHSAISDLCDRLEKQIDGK